MIQNSPPAQDYGSYRLIDLPCGCQDVYYADGRIDREHDHVMCGDGLPAYAVQS